MPKDFRLLIVGWIRDVLIAISGLKYRAGTARSTLPDVQGLIAVGMYRNKKDVSCETPFREFAVGWLSSRRGLRRDRGIHRHRRRRRDSHRHRRRHGLRRRHGNRHRHHHRHDSRRHRRLADGLHAGALR